MSASNLLGTLRRTLRSGRGGGTSRGLGAGHHPRHSYPITVQARDLAGESAPAGGGVETFDEPAAQEINRARMVHLASLGLPLAGKTVLDVGGGVGYLSRILADWGCQVTCTDGREENVAVLRSRHPDMEAHVANVEVDSLRQLGSFHLVFAYGLLYHLENPVLALRNMASACRETLLLETLVTDHPLPLLQMADEPQTLNQGLAGLGCRPTPSYVAMALNRVGFPFVYAPATPPEHPDFRFQWKGNLEWFRDGHCLRCIFVGSRVKLPNPKLVSLLGG